LSLLSSAGERPLAAEGSPPLSDRGLGANFCLGRRRVSQGWQKHFSFGQAKYSAGVMHLCEGCKAADYPCKAPKNLGSGMLCAKHKLVRESWGFPSP